MKTKIIMIRHGFSVANEKNEYAGSMDYPLAELGLRQAELCGKYFRESDISVIYSSNLKRAYDTAVPISREIGLDIFVDQNLRECDGGEWEGKTYDELCRSYPVEYSKWINDIGNAVCPGGESVKDFAVRVLNVVTKIAETHQGETVCITTHATPIRVVTAFAKQVPISELKSIEWCANASINTFEYENGNFYIVELNDDKYLDSLRSNLPHNV